MSKMPNPPGYKPAIIHPDLVAKIRDTIVTEKKRGRKGKVELSTIVNEILREYYEHSGFDHERNPFLEYIEARDDYIYLHDHLINEPIAIQIKTQDKDGKTRYYLHCLKDKREDCLHIGFSFSVRKVYDTLVKYGFKPPKKID